MRPAELSDLDVAPEFAQAAKADRNVGEGIGAAVERTNQGSPCRRTMRRWRLDQEIRR